MFNKSIAIISLFFMGLMTGILVMIYGWGLEPKSWWWIIGGGIVIKLIIEIMQSIAKGEINKQ